MKVVILAGGKGTRISEESAVKPKPMVDIGTKPILWHIMKIYSQYGYHDFVVCCGYKGHMIKEYFMHYHMYQSDTAYDLQRRERTYLSPGVEPWRVTLADTGENTLTAGRILKIWEYVEDDDMFMLTYGDGVGDIDIAELMAFHKSHGRLATITVTQPAGRFGGVKIGKDGSVSCFAEKARKDQAWVNAGFMVLNRDVLSYLGDGTQMFEKQSLEQLAVQGQLMAYRHGGFWSPMDTIHDRDYLNGLWENGAAPWKIWQ